jgi:hypothetical protein
MFKQATFLAAALAAVLLQGSNAFLAPSPAAARATTKRLLTPLTVIEVSMTDEVRIELGPVSIVRDLFSYPNNCHTICFLEQSLEETISLYLSASITRDGFNDSFVNTEIKAGSVFAIISGSAAKPYSKILPEYLGIGQRALEGSRSLHQQKRWLYNWKFFLPHGVSMVNHRSVQLLHFPPDYVLERDQDYLLAHTTRRWAALLTENGVELTSTPQYQNIIDIAPIAAPSNDGKNLEGIYSEFTPYINGLLRLWCPGIAGGHKPLLAFGGPVRNWLKEQYNLDLFVLGLATLDLSSTLRIPILAANHPSFIYNAVKRLRDNPSTPMDERVSIGMRVMQQDLIAAMWQFEMSNDTTVDPAEALSRSKMKWENPSMQKRICELTYIQALDKTNAEAAALCAHLPLIETEMFGITPEFTIASLDQRIESLRDEIGATESDKPDWFS